MKKEHLIIIIAIALAIPVLLYYFLIGKYVLRALLSGVRLKGTEVLFMRIRKTNVELVVSKLILAQKAGLIIKRHQLEKHFMLGGNLDNVMDGLIAAKHKGLKLDFEEATSLDLQKINIVKHLNERV